MTELYTIKWLGYNEKRNYDRIFGHVEMSDGRHYAFWGQRGKKIDVKRHLNHHRIASLIQENTSKGYKQIDPSHYEFICPGFKESLDVWLTTHILQED